MPDTHHDDLLPQRVSDLLSRVTCELVLTGQDDDVTPAITTALTDIHALLQGGAATPIAPGHDEAMDAELAMLQADPELAGMFLAEALDHLSSIEAIALQLETTPGDQHLLNEMFRPFHTVKGNAGALAIT